MTRTMILLRGTTLASLALLTACGGGTGSDTKPISGARPAPPRPSTPEPAAARPKIAFPRGARSVFEGRHTGDPRKDAVLADNAKSVDSVYSAILQNRITTPALRFYNQGVALQDSIRFINGWIDHDNTWTGTIRYFDQKVTFKSRRSASVTYCADETRAYLRNRKTGKIDHSGEDTAGYVLYNSRLQRNAQGVWVTVNVVSRRGATPCKP